MDRVRLSAPLETLRIPDVRDRLERASFQERQPNEAGWPLLDVPVSDQAMPTSWLMPWLYQSLTLWLFGRLEPRRSPPTDRDDVTVVSSLAGEFDRLANIAQKIEQSYLRRLPFNDLEAACDLYGRSSNINFLGAAQLDIFCGGRSAGP